MRCPERDVAAGKGTALQGHETLKMDVGPALSPVVFLCSRGRASFAENKVPLSLWAGGDKQGPGVGVPSSPSPGGKQLVGPICTQQWPLGHILRVPPTVVSPCWHLPPPQDEPNPPLPEPLSPLGAQSFSSFTHMGTGDKHGLFLVLRQIKSGCYRPG